MMQKLFIILLSITPLLSYAQHKKQSKILPHRVGIFASPEWAGYHENFFGGYSNLRLKSNLGYQIGLNVFYELGRRSVLNIGLGYAYRSHEVQGGEYFYTQVGENGDIEFQGTLFGDDIRFSRTFTLPINLYLEYGQYDKSPLFFYTSFGVELNFLGLTKRISDFYDNPEGVNDLVFALRGNQAAKPYQYLVNLGVGVGYQFSERTALRIEPNMRVSAGNPFARLGATQLFADYEYVFGIRTTFTYRLKERKKR